MQHGTTVQGKAPVLPREIEKHMRASRVQYYSKCELLNYQSRPVNQVYRGGKAKRKQVKEEDLSDEEPTSNAASVFLQIQ